MILRGSHTWSQYAAITFSLDLSILHIEVACQVGSGYVSKLWIHVRQLLLLIDKIDLLQVVFAPRVKFLNDFLDSHLEPERSPIVFVVGDCFWVLFQIVLKAHGRVKLEIGPFILFAEVLMCH